MASCLKRILTYFDFELPQDGAEAMWEHAEVTVLIDTSRSAAKFWSLQAPPSNTLPLNALAQKSTAEDVLRIISTREPSTSVNLLSTHTMQATSQSHL